MKSVLITVSLFALLACPIFAKSPIKIQLGGVQDGDTRLLEVSADSADRGLGADGEVVEHYTGMVEIRAGDVTIHSERLTLYTKTKKLMAEGNVVFANKDQTIKATSLEWGYGSKPGKITFVF
ncbi:MAG: hypothetical protein J2P21_17845 [Chloracidobacterium sp.]|nr:hypothetical protein [Chloracidobacterium sp.]